MVWVSVEEIRRDLSAYLQRVEAGETLVIVQAGQPVAEVKPIVSGGKALRPCGLCAGEFSVPATRLPVCPLMKPVCVNWLSFHPFTVVPLIGC